MSKAKRRLQAQRRAAGVHRYSAKHNLLPKCLACGEQGPHFVPPSLGDEGFFMCTETLWNGLAVLKVDGSRPARTNDDAIRRVIEFHEVSGK